MRWICALLWSALWALGCSDVGPCPIGPGTGIVDVTISAPPALFPTVDFIGENTAFSADRSIRVYDVREGSYVVRAPRIKVAGTPTHAPIGAAYSAKQVDAFCVRDRQPVHVHIEYAREAATSKLWIADKETGRIAALAVEDLARTGTVASSTVTPHVEANVGLQRPIGLAWDREGTLFITDESGGLAHRLAAEFGADLKTISRPAIQSDFVNQGVALAFGPLGALWIAMPRRDRVTGILAEEPIEGAISGPALALEAEVIRSPRALAFTNDEDLWIAHDNGTFAMARVIRVVEGTDRSLASVFRAPSDIGAPRAIAFDARGDLFVATNSAVARFLGGDIDDPATGAEIQPKNVLRPAVRGDLTCLAFDEAGALWLGTNAGSLHRLGPGQLTQNGPVTPSAELIVESLGEISAIALNPAPSSLVIFDHE